MRALLVNPWVYDFKAFDFWNKPIGLLVLANLLKRSGVKIDLIDCMDRAGPYFLTSTRTDAFGRGKYHYEVIEKPQIFKEIPRRYKRYGIPRQVFREIINGLDKPDMIFITSSMTYWYPGVFEAIRMLRQKFPKTRIILGGIYATLCRMHAQKYSGADIVFEGPINSNFLSLLGDLGLKKKNNLVPSDLVPNFSVYTKLNYGVIITSQGCPFNCTYCATRFLCPDFAVVPEKVIIEQLDYFRSKTSNIAFFDDALLYNKSFPNILETAIKSGCHLNLHASNGLHCRYIDEKIARLMFRANFRTMYLSLETTNPQVQKTTGGKVSTEEFTDAVAALIKAGFPPAAIHVYLLYGMPGQGHEEIIDGIKLCNDLKVNSHLCEFSPIPHTREFAKTGLTGEDDPLMHNNLFYTWFWPAPKHNLYRKIKDLLSKKR